MSEVQCRAGKCTNCEQRESHRIWFGDIVPEIGLLFGTLLQSSNTFIKLVQTRGLRLDEEPKAHPD